DNVDDFIYGRNVDAQSHLVLRQDLLTGHLYGLPAHFQHVDTGSGERVPEAVRSGRQLADQTPVDVYQPALPLLHSGEGDQGAAAEARQSRQQPLGTLGRLAHIDQVESDRHRPAPEQHTGTGLDYARQLAVQIHDGYLRIGRIDHGEAPRGQFGLLTHDVVG